MLKFPVAVAGVLSESITCTVKASAPAAVGVPLMVPLLLRTRPAGNEPLARIQVSGPMPPFRDMVALYGAPIVPEGKEVVVITTPSMSMLRLTLAVSAFESLTNSVKADLPGVVGVPLRMPLMPSSFKPAGKLPAAILQFSGVVPPFADRVALYAVPTLPPGNEDVAITGGLDIDSKLPPPPQPSNEKQQSRAATPLYIDGLHDICYFSANQKPHEKPTNSGGFSRIFCSRALKVATGTMTVSQSSQCQTICRFV